MARKRKTIKVIFLDIDGVLNSQIFYTERNQEKREKNSPFGANIDERCVGYLNQLIADTGAKVVISSTWRIDGLEYCKSHLEAKGFKGEIIGITPHLRHLGGFRGNEIHQWISENAEMLCGSRVNGDYKEYVIFDDDSDMLYWQRNNYIQVDAYCGLTPNQCYRAKFILCPDMTFGNSFKSKNIKNGIEV